MKTPIKLVTSLLIVMGASYVHAQDYNDYPLKDYILPDIKRSTLDLGINSNGSFASYDNEDKSHNIEGELSADFTNWVNTRRFVGMQSAEFILSGLKQSVSSETGAKHSNFKIQASYDNESQFYLPTAPKWYWLVGGSATISYDKDKNGMDKKSFTGGIVPKVGFGWGRIENVTDARQAVYILNKLKAKGIMTKHLTDVEVNEVAQTISLVKNKRFLDSRKHLINEISTVDSLLVNKGYIQKEGARYFTTLYDYWLYGDLFQRLSGLQVGVKVLPGYQYITSYSHNSELVGGINTDEYKMHVKSVTTQVDLQYEKPINLYWQHSASLSVAHFYQHSKFDDDYAPSLTGNFGKFQAGYYIGYYPTSRTHLRVGVEESISISDIDAQKLYSHTSLNCEAYYYISPQLRLNFSAQIGYKATDKDYQFPIDKWAGSYAVSFTYAIF